MCLGTWWREPRAAGSGVEGCLKEGAAFTKHWRTLCEGAMGWMSRNKEEFKDPSVCCFLGLRN